MKSEIVLNNLILQVRTGSHLYGTNTETSDEDFVGIFIQPTEYLLGFQRVEQVDLSTKSKREDGKNLPEATDFTIYTLEKFCRLALDNNPNILEILFVNNTNVIFWNGVGIDLLALYYSFLSKNIKNRFLGYAFSQKHKMIVKLENYEKMAEAIYYLKQHPEIEFLLDIQHHPLFERKKDFIHVGDVNIPAAIKTKKALESLERRYNKFSSHRKDLVMTYGYDLKFACHLIRLIKEGIELLSTGNLIFPLQYADLLSDIKGGKYTLTEVLDMADTLEKDIESLYDSTKLPHTPNFDVVEQFVIRTHKQMIGGQYAKF